MVVLSGRMIALLLLTVACSSDPPPDPPQPVSQQGMPNDAVHAGVTLPAAPDVVSHCTDEQQVLFSCEIVERPGSIVSLCTSRKITADVGFMDFRFGPVGKPDVSYPAAPTHPSKAFKYASNTPSPDISSSSWSFELDGATYVLSEAAMMGEMTHELTVRQADSSSVSWLCKQPATANLGALQGL